MKKKCPSCKGDGFIMIDETPEECKRCEGEGQIESGDILFEMMGKIAHNCNPTILAIYGNR